MDIESELRELVSVEKTPEVFLILADWLEDVGRVKESEEARETAVALKAWNEMVAIEIEIALYLIDERRVYGFDDLDEKYGEDQINEALANLIQKGVVYKSRLGIFQIDDTLEKLILGKGSEYEDYQTNAVYNSLKKKLG